MDLKLVRREKRSDGIFSEMFDDSGEVISHTLEHSYDDGSGNFQPKLVAGTYTCKRSMHRLHGMTSDFETFQIMDVPDFAGVPVTNILLHWGNWGYESEGCLLTGEGIAQSSKGQMITSSKECWQKIMNLQKGLETFQLTVEDDI